MTTTCCILSLPKWPLLAVDYHCQNDHHLLYIITAKITITCCRLSLPKWPPLATGFHCQNDHHLLQRITAKMTIAYYNLSLGNLPPCVSTSGRSGLMPIGYKHAVLGCGHRNASSLPSPQLQPVPSSRVCDLWLSFRKFSFISVPDAISIGKRKKTKALHLSSIEFVSLFPFLLLTERKPFQLKLVWNDCVKYCDTVILLFWIGGLCFLFRTDLMTSYNGLF